MFRMVVYSNGLQGRMADCKAYKDIKAAERRSEENGGHEVIQVKESRSPRESLPLKRPREHIEDALFEIEKSSSHWKTTTL